jgi:hypothetical protein
MRYLVIFIFFSFVTYSQTGPTTLGGLDFDYASPKEYEIGPVRVVGADNYDHQGIKMTVDHLAESTNQ